MGVFFLSYTKPVLASGPRRPALFVTLVACLVPLIVTGSARATPKVEEQLSEIQPTVEVQTLGTDKVAEVEFKGELTLIYLRPEAEEPKLEKGLPLVLKPAFDAADPRGAFGEVLNVDRDPHGREEIELGPENISSAYEEFELDTENEDIDELEEEADQEIAKSTGQDGPPGPNPLDDLKRVLHCTGKSGVAAELDAKLGKLEPRLEISLAHKRFRFELAGSAAFEGKLIADGAADCEPTFLPKLTIPLLHAPPVFLEIAPVASVDLHGKLKTHFRWGPRITVGAERVDGGRMEPFGDVGNLRPKIAEPTTTGSAGVDLGLEVGISLAKTVAVSGKLGPRLEVESDLLPKSDCPTAAISGYAELSGKINLFVRRWSLTLARGEDFAKRNFPLGKNCPPGPSVDAIGLL